MKSIILILLIFSIPLISSLNTDSPIICREVYYFMVSHMDKNNQVSYTDSELINLSSEISSKIINPISKNDTIYYIKNFTECKDYSLPTKNINTSKYTTITETCSPYTNSTIFGLINIDWSWKMGSINLGTLDCDVINGWKSLFSFEINGTTYSLTGMRVYPFIILGMFGIIGLFFYLRKVKRESDKLNE